MSFAHGSRAVIKIDDSAGTLRDISASVTSVEFNIEVDLPDTTTLGDTAHRHGVVGLKDGSFSVSGLFNPAATTGSHTVLSGIYGLAASSSYEYGPEGTASGKAKYSGECRLKSYRTSAPVDGLVPFSAEFVADDVVTVGVY